MSHNAGIFSHLFGDSLVTPIKHHMAVCHQTATTLTPFFDAVCNDDYDQANVLYHEICSLEKQADQLKREVRLHLPTGLLLAVSRNDLLELIRAQDKIANAARDVAGLVCGRAIRIPRDLSDEFAKCVKKAVFTSQALDETLHHLDTLVGTGFIPSRTRALEAGIDAVDDRERESDDCEHEVRAHLFKIEHEMDPIDVMFLYQVIDLIGEVADRAQHVANRIRIILAA